MQFRFHKTRPRPAPDLLLGGRFGIIENTGLSIAADPLSKWSATTGWRVAYKKMLAENASQIVGKGTSQAKLHLNIFNFEISLSLYIRKKDK